MENNEEKEKSEIVQSKLDDVDDDDEVISELKKSGVPKEITKTISAIMEYGPSISPIERKITPESIDKIIDHRNEQHIRVGEDRKNQRRYRFLYFIATLLFMTIILVYLTERNQIPFLENHIDTILAFVGGAGAGFGAAKLF